MGAANGKGKAMVVASSRPAGLKYFKIIRTILEEKGADYKVLFAFSDYTDPVTNESIEEIKINQLDTLHKNKVIEDVFDLDEYRILVVANKFQTGFDQPLLSAMFLDKSVNGINAIQTVSRLNRKHVDKEQDDILVVDFTNNSDKIFEAFNKHRKGSPYKEKEPDKDVLPELYKEIIATEVFSESEIEKYITAYMDAEEEARKRNSTVDALLSNLNQDYRTIFKTKLSKIDEQKNYISLLNRFVNLYYFIAQFFVLELKENNFIIFAEVMADTLIKKGKTSELKQLLKNIELTKGAVKFHGSRANIHKVKEPKKTSLKMGNGGQTPPRTTIEEALAEIEQKYQISKEDAIVIKEICEEVSKKYDVRQKILDNRDREDYLKNSAAPRVKSEVRQEYMNRDLWEKLEDEIYTRRGGIISLMGKTIIKTILGATG